MTICSKCNEMNSIINKFLFTGDNFMPEMPLRHAGFTYSACVSLKKTRIRKFKGTGETQYICQEGLGKACF